MSNKEALIYYFSHIVKPTVAEFVDTHTGRCDIRRGVLAAITLDHLRDYYLTYLNEEASTSISKSKLTNSLSDECVEILYVRDACNVTKHREINQKPNYSSSSDNIVQEDKPGLFSVPFGEGYFAEASEVGLVFDGGGGVNLARTARVVLEYWNNKIASIG